jgi:hypothetical protein
MAPPRIWSKRRIVAARPKTTQELARRPIQAARIVEAVA